MATPALIIGLGGTGVKVLTLVKRDLMATHQGEVPKEVQLLAFDTEIESNVQAGVATAATAFGAAGAVKLEKERGEYVWIGGNVRDYVRDVARGKFPHVSSWLQAAWYLDRLPDALFFLEAGAGMLRQFGRLAIFYDVLKGAGLSRIYRMTKQAIERVQKARRAETIHVMLVSSVAGGTGAGMFVDMAYLVRRIARQELRVPVALRGFLVMPEAFGTIPSGVTPEMRARAYAAMRENKRFMVAPDWEDGYPMYYHGTERRGDGDDIWQGAAKSKLFDFLYHIDGRRPKNRLDTAPLEYGIAPTVADVIAAFLDEEGGRVFEQHKINLNKAVEQAALNVNSTPFYGTVGTYAYVLPMYHIVEDFAHRLALEVLEELMGLRDGREDRDRDGVPIRLPPDRNAEAGEGRPGRDDALAFLDRDVFRSMQDSDVEVQPTPLIREVGRVAGQAVPETVEQVRGELTGRDLDTWMHFFEPLYAEVEATRREVQAVLQRRVEDVVLTSDKLREKPVDGLRRIEENVKSYKAQHLGAEREGGRREGGDFRRALDKYREIHIEAYRKALAVYCNNVLGGRSTENFREARGGKLGYLADLLDGLAGQLDTFLVLMEEARDVREGRGERGSAIEATRAALNLMKQRASGVIPGQAVAAQRRYLRSEQYLVGALRYEVLEQAVIDTVKAFRELTQAARDQARAWEHALGVGRRSVYAAILDGRKQAASNREETRKVRVWQVVDDPGYESGLYAEYAQQRGDRVNEMLRDLVWRARVEPVGVRHQFVLDLAVAAQEGGSSEVALDADDRKRNVDVLLGRAREAFREVWERESVIKYLRDKRQEPDLADELFQNGGPLLLIETSEGSPIVPANYLRAAFGEDPGDEAYLTSVNHRVANLSGADERFANLIPSADRFKCSLIYTQDLIPVEGTRSFIDAQGDYLRWRGSGAIEGSGREVLHLFPAEVSAVRYEQQAVVELEYTPFLLSDKIVLEMENIERFRLFASCLAFGLVGVGSDQTAGQRRSFWRLSLPADPGSGGLGPPVAGEVYLTDPTPAGEPSLLEAVDTFCYVGKDRRALGAGMAQPVERPIDYPRVLRALLEARRERAHEKLEAGLDLAPDIAAALRDDGEGDREARLLLAERAYILEQREARLRTYLSSNDRHQRDLAVCLYLALTEQVRAVEAHLRDLLL